MSHYRIYTFWALLVCLYFPFLGRFTNRRLRQNTTSSDCSGGEAFGAISQEIGSRSCHEKSSTPEQKRIGSGASPSIFFNWTSNTGWPRYLRSFDLQIHIWSIGLNCVFFLFANSVFNVQNSWTYLPRITRPTCTKTQKKFRLLLVEGNL